jgi:hypothetical protein
MMEPFFFYKENGDKEAAARRAECAKRNPHRRNGAGSLYRQTAKLGQLSGKKKNGRNRRFAYTQGTVT